MSAIAELLVDGGVLFVSLKAGEGGKWDTTSYGPEGPRWYTYWAGADVDTALAAAGLEVTEAAMLAGSKDDWHFRIARRG